MGTLQELSAIRRRLNCTGLQSKLEQKTSMNSGFQGLPANPLQASRQDAPPLSHDRRTPRSRGERGGGHGKSSGAWGRGD
jgi:hypothetical protein